MSVSGVAKRFGGPPVLEDICMEIGRGRIFQLIGPNGSGKTTLINVISGLLRPDRGRIVFDGADITAMGLYETYRQGIVRTWQIPQPFYDLTTAENVLVSSSSNAGESFLLAPLGPRWAADERRVSDAAIEVMRTVGLSDKADVPSKNLSGGQLKLLELARALMSGAEMILMDEPIAGVNPHPGPRHIREDLVDMQGKGRDVPDRRAPARHIAAVRGPRVCDGPRPHHCGGHGRRGRPPPRGRRVVPGAMTMGAFSWHRRRHRRRGVRPRRLAQLGLHGEPHTVRRRL